MLVRQPRCLAAALARGPARCTLVVDTHCTQVVSILLRVFGIRSLGVVSQLLFLLVCKAERHVARIRMSHPHEVRVTCGLLVAESRGLLGLSFVVSKPCLGLLRSGFKIRWGIVATLEE